MKKLIIIRHGEYDFDLSLSDFGKEQMASLSIQIGLDINGDKVKVLSSTATRAEESAQIIADALGLSFSTHEVLWSESSHPEDLESALRLVREEGQGKDIIILVTHLEYAERFPDFFAREEFGESLSGYGVEKGQAWAIDCESVTMEKLVP